MASSVMAQDVRHIAERIKKEGKRLSGATLLISGGSGFLGSYIIATIDWLNKKYLKKPCRVISVDNFITGKKRSILEEIDPAMLKQVEADVTKPFAIDEKVDFIIHAAGIASPVFYKKYPMETLESAIFGAKNLLELAKEKNVKSFLFFSSSEIYGDPDPNFIPTPETYRGNVSSIGPRSCYDESKRLGETLCMIYFEKYGVPAKIVRPFNVYGPGMWPDDKRVIPSYLSSALLDKPLPVHDKGNQTRTFCYITDAITGFLKVFLSDHSGEVFNIGNDTNEVNMLSLARTVSMLFPKGVEIKTVEYPKSYPQEEPRRRRPDITKAKTLLGYEPLVELSSGLKRTLKWYREEFPGEFR
jgi:UDP-glucuronate decarboxylase